MIYSPSSILSFSALELEAVLFRGFSLTSCHFSILTSSTQNLEAFLYILRVQYNLRPLLHPHILDSSAGLEDNKLFAFL
jgi:hypothetical protein